MKVYKKQVSSRGLYKQFLVLINYLLGLTSRELDVLALLLEIQEEKPTFLGKPTDILSADNRRIIMSETLVNKNNLSKYIKHMKSKGIILKDDKGSYINSMFVPEVKDGIAELMFILEIDNG